MEGLSLIHKILNFVLPMYEDSSPVMKRLEYIERVSLPDDVDRETLRIASLLIDVVKGHEKEVKFFLSSVGMEKEDIESLVMWLHLTRLKPQDLMGRILDDVRKKFPVRLSKMD